MLIPITISLLISTIFLNIGLALNGSFFLSEKIGSAKTGAVLGAAESAESQEAKRIIINQNNNLSRAVAGVLEEAKNLPRPRLLQLPQLDQPLRRVSTDQAEKPKLLDPDYDLPAQNGVILDYDDSLFFAKRPDQSRPIASITKLFTAYTFLDYNPGWEASYEIRPEDKREGGKIYLFTGDRVKVKDLFYFSLVGSDNTATAALVQSTGLSEEEFVKKMNAKVNELGLKNTRLVDPVGLKDGNISTAREVALFTKIALAKEEISRASVTKVYEFKTEQGRKKIITSTNELLNSFPAEGISLLGGKTGHVNSSGYCLAGQFKNYDGQAIVTVILGAESDRDRFSLTKKLVDLYYKNRP